MNDVQGMSAPGTASSSVWGRLKAAREAHGLSLPELASRTRVTQRYLEALEEGRPNDLPSPTYASGFAKAYARAVGLDEVEIGRGVREEIARIGAPVRQYSIQEIADPARGPSRGLVVITAGLALAVLILAILWFATGMFRGTKEAATAPAAGVVASVPTGNASAAAPTPASRPVVLTANDQVWVRVYDTTGKRLFEGTMKQGDRFAVPADDADPMINIGRPDKLAITVGGQPVAPLGDGRRAIKDVRVSAAALLARGTSAAGATPTGQTLSAPTLSTASTRSAPGPAGPVRATVAVPPAAKAASLPAATSPAPTATSRD